MKRRPQNVHPEILFAPLSLILSLFVWLCAGLLSCSGFVFKLASGLLSLLAFAVLITYSVKNGIILLVLAFLSQPDGTSDGWLCRDLASCKT